MRVVLALLLGIIAGAFGAVLVGRALAPPAPFTFAVEQGQCACSFDDDAASWDFARNRERIRRTVCAGR